MTSAAPTTTTPSTPVKRPPAAIHALHIDDVSQFAKQLRASLSTTETAPTHLQLLNLITKAAGRGNYQAFLASAEAAPAVVKTVAAAPAVTAMSAHAAKALTQFDDEGRLIRWPNKFAVQRIALWGLWLPFAMHRRYTEREVNALLNTWHAFGDPATLRRELVEMKFLARTPDCREYWKLVARPDEDVKAFLSALRGKRTAL
ncbi:MAG: DUF2087 domain-containing protein [Betaproteobacteria bacterium]|nr:MAG: DUF2087 domain-containing protein [Betaproteobacteria bacterium]